MSVTFLRKDETKLISLSTNDGIADRVKRTKYALHLILQVILYKTTTNYRTTQEPSASVVQDT